MSRNLASFETMQSRWLCVANVGTRPNANGEEMLELLLA